VELAFEKDVVVVNVAKGGGRECAINCMQPELVSHSQSREDLRVSEIGTGDFWEKGAYLKVKEHFHPVSNRMKAASNTCL